MTLSFRAASGLTLACAAALACGSEPLPLAAQAGSTIAVPVAGELTYSAGEIGYGSDLLEQAGRFDDQRGKLVFKLAGGAVDHQLVTRVISRLAPDPSTQSAIDNNGDEFFSVGIAEVVALVDIPASVPSGNYTMTIERCRRTQEGGACEALPPGLIYSRPFTVLPGTGVPNPMLEFLGGHDTSEGLRRLYPYPKFILKLGTPRPAAAHVVINYPKFKLLIMTVFEEQNQGRGSIVSWVDDPVAGTLTIDFVDPNASVASLAIAFDLQDPFFLGRAVPSDLSIASAQRYGANGAAISGTISMGGIR